MSVTNDSVSLHQTNPTLEHLFHALDPISLILNQNSQPFPLRLTTADSFIMERGPKYKAYAELRETRLRLRRQQQQQQEHDEVAEPKVVTTTTPPRKQVKFQGNLGSMRKGCSSILAQSVPDFTSALRKENKKPVNSNSNRTTLLPSLFEITPPMKSFSNKGSNDDDSGSRGSKSASAAGEKKKVASVARKSYASIDELKSLSSATANAINIEGRGGRSRGVMGKSVSGYYRQF
ncbi:hypothetical protein RIF29_19467 [Crotalaria pallida]|uniref:Uncharacterized protein n=1 Tax=Crotalaria pallida TaxID=3830 RepID=A0AAN9F0S0_CROPI